MVFTYDSLKVTAQLVDMNHHVSIQNRRCEIANLFADEAEVLLVGFRPNWSRLVALALKVALLCSLTYSAICSCSSFGRVSRVGMLTSGGERIAPYYLYRCR